MHHRHLLRVMVGVFLALLAAIALAIYWALPPSRMVLVAGAPQSSYANFAERYREQLAHHGVTLEVRPTGGGLQNLESIRDAAGGVDLALVPTGLAPQSDAPHLVSLGGVARGAMWLFYRQPRLLEKVSDLNGLRICTGAPGSSVNEPVRVLLAEGGALDDPSRVVQLTEREAVAGLVGGTLDAIFLFGLPDSESIRTAMHLPGVRLMNVAQAGAIAQRDKSLTTVVLPRGYIDLKADLPPIDSNLLAASSSLIARRDLHPALQYLMLEVARNVHREPDVFQRYGEFPAPLARDLPLSPYADRFYRHGRPFLFDSLPFWLAAFADRAVWIGVPLMAILLPALQMAMPGFLWLTGRRLRACVRELRVLEREIHQNREPSRWAEFSSRLASTEETVRSLSVPEGLAGRVFEVRGAIDYVKRDLHRLSGAAAGDRPPVDSRAAVRPQP